MTTVDGIVLTIAIPQNLMHFYCSLNSGKATLNDIQKVHPTAQYNSEGTIVFDLKKENPQMLRDIIQAVKTSSSITMTNKCKKHQKNRSFLEALEVRNQIHKYDPPLTVSDIAKVISYDNYDTSMIAEDKEFSGKELHAFHNKVVFALRLLVREYQSRLSGQRAVDYSSFTAFAEDFENTINKIDEIDAEVNTGYSREDMEYLTLSDAEYNSYYREIRDFVDTARLAVNDDYATALENILAGVVDDAEYIRSDDFLMQLNPLIKYDDAFEEMQNIMDNFTRAVSRKQKVTVKAFKELLANLQNELNELPKN